MTADMSHPTLIAFEASIKRTAENDVRRYLLHNVGATQSLGLTPHQRRIVLWVAEGPHSVDSRIVDKSSAALAEHLQMSVVNASAQLRELARRGYLVRDNVGALSGGCEYVYRLAEGLA